MQFLPNFIVFACGAPLPFGNLLKGLKELLALLQKVIGLPFDHFASGICELHATPIISAIYRWENLIQKKNKMEGSLKFCLPSAVSIPMKAYPTIPLSGQSNLVRRYL